MTPKAACILIVEDDADLGFLLQEVLKREGHRVDIVETGAAALARLQRGTYDLILLDLRLPDGDGLERLPHYQELAPDVPIILMTGFGWDPSHSIVKARQEGLQTVLYKPFRVDRLMEAVEQALRPPSPPEADGVLRGE